MSDNPYQPPRSSLTPEPSGGRQGGSLEGGVAGRYRFTIPEVFEEAWRALRGAKTPILRGLLMIIGVSLAGAVTERLLGLILPESAQPALNLGLNLLVNLVTAPMAAGAPLDAQSVLGYFDRMLPCFLVSLVTGLLLILFFGAGAAIMVGLKNPLGVLFFLPGIYFAIVLQLAPLLVVEKGLRPMAALSASRLALSRQFPRVFGFYLALWLSIALAIFLTLGIGMLWAIPFAVIAQGIVYREVFGVEDLGDAQNEAPSPSAGGRMTA